ncbi:hypothetical protein JW921_08375 [Candidatus Fermentibacterales bacterium]|nr:hypothetical protein [Candidatus Fermentibacterales bacterium]
MLPFMFPFIADTVAVPYDDNAIKVHEWGVVEFQEAGLTAIGAHWGELGPDGILYDYFPDEVEAPVVWFYGPDFTGSLSIEVSGGRITEAYPAPDVEDLVEMPPPFGSSLPPVSHRMEWTGLSFGSGTAAVEQEELTRRAGFGETCWGWAAGYWRDVPALSVQRQSDGWTDGFIYYECTASQALSDLDWTLDSLRPAYGQALLFGPGEGDSLRAALVGVGGSLELIRGDLQDGPIRSVICGWGGNLLDSREVSAIWNTWKPRIRARIAEDGQPILLFALPPDLAALISTIELTVDQGYEVSVQRLFLGLMPVAGMAWPCD